MCCKVHDEQTFNIVEELSELMKHYFWPPIEDFT